MSEIEADFEKIVSRFNIDDGPNPAHRENLRRQMLSIFDKSEEESKAESRRLWRTIMKSPILKLAAAAVIIIAITVGVYHFKGSMDGATVAFAQMAEAIKKTPWMHVVEEIQSDEKEWQRQQEFWYSFESQIKIVKTPDGTWYRDYGKGKILHYDTKSDTITIKPLSTDRFLIESPEQFLQKEAELILEFPQATVSKRFGEHNGRRVEILEFTFSHLQRVKDGTPSKHRKVRGRIVADLRTRLPIYSEYESVRLEDKSIRKSHSICNYPQTGPKDIYALGVPQTAQIIDKTDISVAKATDGSKQYATDTAAPKLVPIDFDLPRPMFVGTPQDTKVPNLEEPLGKPRPPFLAPPGTKNVAFEKPVTSTDDFPIIGELEMITDGDKEAADGSYVELGPLKQSVTIDLEVEYNIYAILVWHFHKQARVYFDVIVQASSDADFVEATTLYNNDIDNSSGVGVGEDKHYTETNEGRLIDAKGIKARYVRLYSNGNNYNDLNHYIEVEVYGTPVE